MRHLPGGIAISDDADVPLLRAVHRAGHLTVHQLYASLYSSKEKGLWDTLNWRVRRLVTHKFLDRTPMEGCAARLCRSAKMASYFCKRVKSFWWSAPTAREA